MIKNTKQAVVLAGGRGTRLRPYTSILPKPLMPVGDIPILEVIVRQLRHHGFREIILAVGYLSSLIEAYFGNGEKWGVDIRYSHEPKALGTVGPLKLIDNLRPPFILMNGDVLTTLDYSKLFSFHLEENPFITVAAHEKSIQINLGVINKDDSNYISGYTEKPKLDYLASMGVYVFGEQAMDFIEKDEYMDFPDLIQLLVRRQHPVKVYPFNGRWIDIGIREEHEKAIEVFEALKHEFIPE